MRRVLFSLDPAPGNGSTDSTPEVEAVPKIRAFGQRLGGTVKADDDWKRKPCATGSGALHVRSFHCKMGGDALTYLDRQINDWLDEHPDCDVKFATMAVGEWSGTVREPHLVVQIWV